MAALKQKEDGSIELDFTVGGLVGAMIANVFASFKALENKKMMETDGLKERFGSVGNQFALMTIISLLVSIPLMMYREGPKLEIFYENFKTDKKLFDNVILSGLTFYMYNELSTMTLKKISAVTQSVANTAKRVVVIVGSAIVFNESISGLKAVGCAICIGGVFLNSVIDDLIKPKQSAAEKEDEISEQARIRPAAALLLRCGVRSVWKSRKMVGRRA